METIQQKQIVQQVYTTLRIVFVIVPIVAGLDKFTNILCQWTQYINPSVLNFLPFSGETFMMVVGVIEIIAGILVLLSPRIGGLIVSVWLTLIALTLLAWWNFLDVAVRDLVMAITAFSMTRLASIFDRK
ncbi:tRNA (5-methylaminomethyl-2-thiouridylate)-methyltransferase [Chryseobacterium sp. P1-3]|uniref:DoxX family membrane protein n=1 Tax=Chryseobacterium gallinarum TaxID=1324352 RepID=A0A0G3M5U3_CHRGL|nr:MULTISPECIES: DoxX family membrane protein [Chryseobacterium]AKK74234.1 tRNA (5-methylaminomethyl-2-thiouridylate)-methyltransferase [Chryseobacterium gallinarum]KFF74547.1 tRNA (5-methylaminomethyl-2-thiouridylate)-methyltransferase [Chryseobacterium sp. P1-3]MCL8538084.1 DoxX family membrane protein [Chryseobacterium gallinarum]QIY89935.1 DoxX family membrane protein [Chryseobacterium gallinarum]